MIWSYNLGAVVDYPLIILNNVGSLIKIVFRVHDIFEDLNFCWSHGQEIILTEIEDMYGEV